MPSNENRESRSSTKLYLNFAAALASPDLSSVHAESKPTLTDSQAKAEQAKAQVQIVYYEQIAALRVQQTTVRDKLAEMQNATGEAWESVKVGFDSAWTDLKSGLAGAVAKFK